MLRIAWLSTPSMKCESKLHSVSISLSRSFVLADDGSHDAALVQLFHQRNHRAQMLLGPPGSAMTRHNPIPGFAKSPAR